MIRPVFCALDTHDLDKAEALAAALKGHVGGLKLGLEFFLAHGAAGYARIAALGLPIFLDLKLHDIPNTVAGGVKAVLPLAPTFITLHTGGGAAMMRAAAAAAKTAGDQRPKLLGVTVLTSMDAEDLRAVGQDADTGAQVLRLAKLAKASGLDGVVCSPEEVALLRRELGADFILMVPGIRPGRGDLHPLTLRSTQPLAGDSHPLALRSTQPLAAGDDQKRVMTPREAMDAGATHLVIGRPITGADDPAAAAKKIGDELG